MRITVFGGGGFIGSTIVDRLLRDNHEICVFERPRVDPYRQFNDSEKVHWMTGDLTSVHDVTEAIDGSDIVVHLVSTTLPKSSNDDPIYDVQSNLVATLQLLNAMVAKNVKKIVFISSGGTVYGDPVYLPIDEKHPTNPKVSYGITKLAIEKYLLLYQYQYGIKANILRVANPYGERQRVETAQGAIAVFLDKALRKQPFEIWGDGTVTRDYLYIGDVAEAFARAVQYDGSESVFNISSGYGTSLNEIIGKIEAILGHPVERTYRPGRPFDVPASVLDNTLAKRELGWEPKVALDAGIKMTAAWLRSQIHE
ncbi:NAD-dependent epimerase/dehydratase family protein [Paraburkholderia sp. Tr-20389]|uniref:NAD-dependent epimerase/dehydratase family protein n=1 Tax=Paraburkholderia sp. Tr-20389 TaxID=2703903 RepID=UPI00197F11A4|nr:NAD-dependent epimerase/dehydratase family protein [Paraburkholderia sp. Tr-20389]MBN3753917.1 NAD-dependent epimerase/dehydratase family protein [Paraburkholderia sp. Tr-20389]